MNCAEFQSWLQNRLDGCPGSPIPAAEHLAVCAECRSWLQAVERLDTGLSLLHSEHLSALVTERIVTQVLADRRGRLRQQRMRTVAGVLAASILLATLAMALVPRWLNKDGHQTVDQPLVVKDHYPNSSSTELPSSRSSMAEGGLAVASLANRAKEETLKQTRLLFPVADAALAIDKIKVAPSFGSPAESLSEAGKGVSEGLKPVTNSARRAWDLFLRELPPIDSSGKSNS